MKNSLLKPLTFFLLLFIASTAFSQDKIYKKNDEVILCKVTEIGEDEIKYTKEASGDLVFVLDKSKIEKIVLENGKELVFTRKMTDPELYADQKKNAFKFGLFSPVTGATSLGYERSLKPGASIETSIGIIGLGLEAVNENKAKGAYLKFGYKFIMTPDFELKGMRYSHLLKGFYFRPDIAFATYNRDFFAYDQSTGKEITERSNVVSGAIMLDFGKQWVMSDVFLVDIFVGVGYGFDNMSTKLGYSDYNYNGPSYHYGFTIGENVPIALSAGFKVGFLTK